MTSYQKLKYKCEYLEGQVNIFKNALTACSTGPKLELNNGVAHLTEGYQIIRNKIDEECKEELQKWVAENLDIETISHLLKIKEELENGKINQKI